MPLDGSSLSMLSSSVPSGSDFFNGISTLMNNLQQQRFSKQMYQRQYKDSIDFWNMQNAYNTPQMQMERFKAAGLNPHLIYGQGNSGAAGSVNVPDVQPVNFREPRFEGGNLNAMSSLLMGADLRIKGAQADNLFAQNEVIRQDALLRRLQAEREGFDLGLERSLADVSADARRAGLRKMQVETDVMIERNAREAALNSSNIQEAAQRMLTLAEQRKSLPLERGRIISETRRTNVDTARLRESIKLLEQDGVLKKFDIKLREMNLNPNDPLWARYAGMFLSDIYEGRLTATNIMNSVWRWIID